MGVFIGNVASGQSRHADDGIVSGGVAQRAGAIISGGGNHQRAGGYGCIAGAFQRLGVFRAAETEVDDVGAVFHGVCNGFNHVDGLRIIRAEDLQRHDLDFRHDAGDAGVVVRVGKEHAGHKSAVPLTVCYICIVVQKIMRLDDFRGIDVLVMLTVADPIQSAVNHGDGHTAAILTLFPCGRYMQRVQIPLGAACVERVVHGGVQKLEFVVWLDVVDLRFRNAFGNLLHGLRKIQVALRGNDFQTML